jgi:hypothetical protein
MTQSRYSFTVSISIPSSPSPSTKKQKFKPLVGTRLKHQLIKVQIISMPTSTVLTPEPEIVQMTLLYAVVRICPAVSKHRHHCYLPSHSHSHSSLCVTGEEYPKLVSRWAEGVPNLTTEKNLIFFVHFYSIGPSLVVQSPPQI